MEEFNNSDERGTATPYDTPDAIKVDNANSPGLSSVKEPNPEQTDQIPKSQSMSRQEELEHLRAQIEEVDEQISQVERDIAGLNQAEEEVEIAERYCKRIMTDKDGTLQDSFKISPILEQLVKEFTELMFMETMMGPRRRFVQAFCGGERSPSVPENPEAKQT